MGSAIENTNLFLNIQLAYTLQMSMKPVITLPTVFFDIESFPDMQTDFGGTGQIVILPSRPLQRSRIIMYSTIPNCRHMPGTLSAFIPRTTRS